MSVDASGSVFAAASATTAATEAARRAASGYCPRVMFSCATRDPGGSAAAMDGTLGILPRSAAVCGGASPASFAAAVATARCGATICRFTRMDETRSANRQGAVSPSASSPARRFAPEDGPVEGVPTPEKCPGVRASIAFASLAAVSLAAAASLAARSARSTGSSRA